ncbi:MAG: O-antigen ligase family protein [Defluviitaleaceae bacterium]|nr:O-antigen ligase family protein [Defluviitaleaceae bacterium]MCL2239820.1 O-antigen ligase family protein [Defluviitaleaceae bacterium]
MQTHSFIINKIIALLAALNFYYEQSLIYRAVDGIKKALGGSRVVTGIFYTDVRAYWEGSLLMRCIAFAGAGLLMGLRRCVRAVAKANQSSLNKKIYLRLGQITPPAIIGKALTGCVPYRLVAWFFADCHGAVKIAPYKLVYMLFLCGALMVPGPLWSNAYLLLSAGFFSTVFAIKWSLSTRERPSFSHISPALVLFVLFCVVSIFTGYGGMDSARVFVIFFSCVVHSVLVSLTVRDMKELRLFIKLLAVALAFTAVFGFYQLAVGIPIRPEFTDLLASPGLARLHSTFGNPNNDAKAWTMLLPLLMALIITVKCDKKRLLLMGVMALSVAALALTYSRAGYIALVAGVGVFVLLSAPRLVPIGLVAFIAAIPFLPAGIIDRMLTLGTDTSSVFRFNIWLGVLDMLRDYWVQGIGMGPDAFLRIYDRYANEIAWRAVHAHNTFLDIFAHSGIGALLAFAAYLFGLFKGGILARKKVPDTEHKIFLAAGIASLSVFIVFGMGEYMWFYPRVMLVFWIIAGLLTATTNGEITRDLLSDEDDDI